MKRKWKRIKIRKRKNHLTNHQRNLEYLMIEIYKAKYNLSPEFMKEVFLKTKNCNLRGDNHLELSKVMTLKYCTENIIYRGYLLLSSIPREIKSSNTLAEFKEHIKLSNGNI